MKFGRNFAGLNRMGLSSDSMIVRGLLVGVLAIGVTVGGVMAGALVVAPVVAKATSPQATTQFDQTIATAMSTSRAMLSVARERVMSAAIELPAPAKQYGLPAVAMISIVAALSVLMMRRRTPARSLAPSGFSEIPASGKARLTPHGSSRPVGKNQRTPRAVEALAASGASTSDIARRTGLPIDAIQLLLAISTGARQLQPPTA